MDEALDVNRYMLLSGQGDEGGDCDAEQEALADVHKASAADHDVLLTNTECIKRCKDAFWEPTIFNLGQAYRKMQRYADAGACFRTNKNHVDNDQGQKEVPRRDTP